MDREPLPTGEWRSQAGGVLRLESCHMPSPDRAAVFCEVFARQVLRVHAEPVGEQPFRVNMTLGKLPGLSFMFSTNSKLWVGRTRAVLDDGIDDVIFHLPDTDVFATHRGREMLLAAGDAIPFLNSEEGSLRFAKPGRLTSLLVPRAALGPLLKNPDVCLGRPIPAHSPALGLLRGYIGLLGQACAEPADVQQLAVAHVCDLLALALGAHRDAAQAAMGRGVRAARLHAIKTFVRKNLDRPLAAGAVAARHRITARYMAKMFEEDGVTFTEFVREQRLVRAHRILMSPRFAEKRIGEIAFGLGFNDLSYFNRMFRRRYGLSPGEVRALAADGEGRAHLQ